MKTSATLSALVAVLVVALSASTTSLAGADEQPRDLLWDDLMPADWNPFDDFVDKVNALGDHLMDGTPEAEALMREYREIAVAAPVVEELDGQRVRIPGYVVPLDFSGTEVTEFLLVPYFGACIHVPPPPKNQIVFVEASRAHRIKGLFEAVWVTGTLQTEAALNELGDAGYTMRAARVEPYEE